MEKNLVKPVRKAVFPVAGMGTRFLPATKANPKEMLPIVDKPLLQYAVEEAVAAGITQLIFVTNHAKYSIENYFDTNYELESRLRQSEKYNLLEIIQNILPKGVSCLYIRQAEPLGLGDAVLKAYPAVGFEPFAVLLADDLLDCPRGGCLKQMIEQYDVYQNSIVAVESIDIEQSQQYGIVSLQQGENLDLKSRIADQKLDSHRVKAIVEKPLPSQAPSNLGVTGRYILNPTIFDALRVIHKGASGELQLTDAIARLLETEAVYAYQFEGKRYDCGSKLGYLEATLELGLRHSEVGEKFKNFLSEKFLSFVKK